MLEILSNGNQFKNPATPWITEFVPQPIEKLIDLLTTNTLDPMFEQYGNFVCDFTPYGGWNEETEKYRGCSSYFGNFIDYSHAFRIITNDAETIEKLNGLISINQDTEAYKQHKIEMIECNKIREEEQQKRFAEMRKYR